MFKFAEYLWVDGTEPTPIIRSKARVMQTSPDQELSLKDFPEWSFDGSSTNQAAGNKSDCMLRPVRVLKDPIRGEGNHLVVCEVLLPDGRPHPSNTRAKLRRVLDAGGAAHDPWIGFEQEYTLMNGAIPLGWPEEGFPGPQGPYYCSAGTGRVIGRDMVERHAQACLDAGIMLYGVNAEVMYGQWEYQIGYRGAKGESADVLNVSDHLIAARWLMERISEDFGISVTLSPKPVKGDWNGAGNHSNFSTKGMRDSRTGQRTIDRAVESLRERHELHISNYGAGLTERLTGLHETSDISEFRAGRGDRGASIRIPSQVAIDGHGYIEDRRPAANCDPYLVSALLVNTICEIGINLFASERIPALV